MKGDHGWDWLQSRWVLLAGFVATVITLFVFFTGKQSIQDLFSRKGPSEVLSTATHPNVPLPTPSSTGVINISTITPSLKESPEEFIISYYALISNRQYATAFSLLSDDFKERNHSSDTGGFQGYVDWWNSIKKVDVWSATTEYEEGKTAKVVAIIHYEPNSSNYYEDEVYFQLIYDTVRATWLIDATPFR